MADKGYAILLIDGRANSKTSEVQRRICYVVLLGVSSKGRMVDEGEVCDL